MTEQDLFELVIKTPEAERAALLDRACQGKSELRSRMEEMLKAKELSSNLPTTDIQAPSYPGQQGEMLATIIAGKYKLREKLGEGGMGSVWVADQSEPIQRRVAIKLIKVGSDSRSILARFEQERQALALMDHPNIAKVFDAGVEGHQPYFVMELIKGVPLTKYCDDAKLTTQQRLELFIPVCQAVQHAHQKGIIHRDLKPNNIIVGLYDGRPVPKVIDFGVAKATGPKLTDQSIYTEVGSLVGTLEYMSPEQAELNNLDIDTRTDIYALGVILYELLTGSVPFSRKELANAGFGEMLRVIKEVDPPKPSTKLSGSETFPSIAASRHTEPAKLTRLVKGELDWMVMKALEKDRSRRYDTATSFAIDVQRYLVGDVISAAPPSIGYQFRKFFKKHRAKLIAIALIFSSLVAGVIGTSVGFYRAIQATESESLAKKDALKSAETARNAQKQTQKRLDQIEKGMQLFANILDGIDPRYEEQLGKPLYDHLREQTEKAVDQLNPDAVADPLTVARIQNMLGKTLENLGSSKKAVEVLEKARDVFQRQLGQEHDATITNCLLLSSSYLRVGNISEAIAILERIRVTQEKKLGPDHAITIKICLHLARAYVTATRIHEAIPLYEKIKELRIQTLGEDHIDSAVVFHELAVAYMQVERVQDAILLFEKARDVRNRKKGVNHQDTLATLVGLGHAYTATGKPKEAIRILQPAHDAFVSKLGIEHPNTLETASILAEAYMNVGKTREAISAFKQVHQSKVKKLGADNPATLNTLDHLARAYWLTKQLDQSVPLFEEILKQREKSLGRGHPLTLLTIANLGVNYRDAKRLSDAIPLLEEAYRSSRKHPMLNWVWQPLLTSYYQQNMGSEASKFIETLIVDARNRFPKESPQLSILLAELGITLLDSRKYSEAEPFLREALAIDEKKTPDSWKTFYKMTLLGSSLHGQKKYREAEPILLQSYAGLKIRERSIPKISPYPSLIPETVDLLIQVYKDWGKPDEQKKWHAEKEKLTKSAPDQPH